MTKINLRWLQYTKLSGTSIFLVCVFYLFWFFACFICFVLFFFFHVDNFSGNLFRFL